MTAGQAKHQQDLDDQMKKIESHLARLNRDTVFYVNK